MRFVNSIGDVKVLDMFSDLCSYDRISIEGATGTCFNSTEEYSVINPESGAEYEWEIIGDGTFVGENTGNTVLIQWGSTPGVSTLIVSQDNTDYCMSPESVSVFVGHSSGSLTVDDEIFAFTGENCEVEVTPEMLISTPVDPNTPYKITLYDSRRK
ncbi:MAG: hypothetical protein R2771_07340 [Saprospiraceae bacterium]